MVRTEKLASIPKPLLDNYIGALEDAHRDDILRDTVLSHPAIFAAHFFGLALGEFHVDMLWSAHTEPRVIILFPEAHGKSTLIAKIMVIYEICRNPNIRIVVMMKTDETAWQYSDVIREVLDPIDGNPELNRLFGPFKGSKWGRREINVAKRQIKDPFPTIRFMGAKPTAVGTGCDILVGDDLVHFENSATKEAREKLSKWWNTTAQTMPRCIWDRDMKTGWLKIPEDVVWPRDSAGKPEVYERIVLIGTMYALGDLLSEKAGDTDEIPQGRLVFGRDKTFKVLYYDCWKDEAETVPLWPEHRDAAWLNAERESRGPLEFNKRLRNKPVDESQVAIKLAWVKGGVYDGVTYNGCCDLAHRIGAYQKLTANDGHLVEDPFLVLGVDPSSGRKTRRSTWSSYILLAADKTVIDDEEELEIWLVDLWRGQIGFDDIISQILEGDELAGLFGFHSRYDYNVCRVETNDKQLWLLDSKRVQKANRVHPGLIQGWDTQINKINPEIGVRAMDVLFKDSKLHIPWERVSDHAAVAPFVEQLCKFPEGTTDYVMAFWFAYMTLKENLIQPEGFYLEGYKEGLYLDNPYFISSATGTVVEPYADEEKEGTPPLKKNAITTVKSPPSLPDPDRSPIIIPTRR